jgi:hypothetical protein
MRLAAFVPMLLDRFPDAAFTPASLEHVAARAAKGFPTYGELAGWLAEWWRDNRPMPTAIAAPLFRAGPPPPPRDPPTPEERAHVRRVAAEAIAALRSEVQPVFDRRPTALYATPAQLDLINPLPDGRKRHDPAKEAAAAVDPDAA